MKRLKINVLMKSKRMMVLKNKHSYGLVKVYSQELLQLLNQNHCMGELKDVVFDTDRNQYVYLFAETEEVTELIVRFEKEYGKDREIADGVYYVTNYQALNQIIDMGYGNMLVGTFWSKKNNKRVFVFQYDVRIEKINENAKENARQEYSRKHNAVYDDRDVIEENW